MHTGIFLHVIPCKGEDTIDNKYSELQSSVALAVGV